LVYIIKVFLFFLYVSYEQRYCDAKSVNIIRRHGSVSALKCMRDEMHRVPLREPVSCEHS